MEVITNDFAGGTGGDVVARVADFAGTEGEDEVADGAGWVAFEGVLKVVVHVDPHLRAGVFSHGRGVSADSVTQDVAGAVVVHIVGGGGLGEDVFGHSVELFHGLRGMAFVDEGVYASAAGGEEVTVARADEKCVHFSVFFINY